jgi:hypothetical protein
MLGDEMSRTRMEAPGEEAACDKIDKGAGSDRGNKNEVEEKLD